MEESVRIFLTSITDPSECSIALDNVAHVIAAEIDGFNDDDATMEELSENEDFYPEDDLREENKNESEPEKDNHSDDNLDEDFVVTTTSHLPFLNLSPSNVRRV